MEHRWHTITKASICHCDAVLSLHNMNSSVTMHYIICRCDLLLWDSDEPVPRSELLKKVEGAHGILCLLSDRIDAEVLNAAGMFFFVLFCLFICCTGLDGMTVFRYTT